MRHLIAIAAALALAAPASAAVPNPEVQGPVEGGIHNRPANHSLFDLHTDDYDYVEQEFFYGGTATDLGSGLSAPYRTRMLVRLPRRAQDFSGVVVVEWLNVTGQEDLETDWPIEAEHLMRHGVGYVGVSAQHQGVLGGPYSLQVWDPQRYGTLLLTQDTFSYDIFSQAIEALRDPRHNVVPTGSIGPVDPARGLKVKKIAVTGASQSAGYLTDFVNGGYARGGVDLFVITRGGGPYNDFSTPIFNLNEENNEIPQPDNARFVGWEEAGTAHAPAAWWSYVAAQHRRDGPIVGAQDPISTACSVNRGRVDYSARALSAWGLRYLQTGQMPPSAPRMDRDESGNLVRDANGLAKGGLRHSFVEVPVAFNTSDGCPLWGDYQAWDEAKIRSLYPTHCGYIGKVRDWADHEVERGWLLPLDRDGSIREAVDFDGPWPDESLADCAAARFEPCVADGFVIEVPRLMRGRGVRSARILVNGKRVATRKGGASFRLQDVPAGKVEVTFVAKLRNGKHATRTQTLRSCDVF